ncbi:unnamed protein product [Vitrella brassicaformis CCMP3155]|uniref:Trimethylguanosine synthase n=2 Tax=Vitrella brassicaformis TaxID=1169539 RepID=A0A0G4G2K0_VITBC|nr:unnamed protein product [Vitrella brassicaformis CCMP3155]|eukprot:CEM21909.1 unnamed protein product [Vitrella brassicaformis CCMP3155]
MPAPDELGGGIPVSVECLMGLVTIMITTCPHAETGNEWLWGNMWKHVKYNFKMRRSITPRFIADCISNTIVAYLGLGIVLDAFSGVGGQTASLLAAGLTVYACDIDRTNVEHTTHNASVHGRGVLERLFMKCGDYFKQVASLASRWAREGKKFAAIHFDMPWGDEYKNKTYDINKMGDGTMSAFRVLDVAASLTDSFVVKCPKTVPIADVLKLAYYVQSIESRVGTANTPLVEVFMSGNKTTKAVIYIGDIAKKRLADIPPAARVRDLTRQQLTIEECASGMSAQGKAVGCAKVLFEPHA